MLTIKHTKTSLFKSHDIKVDSITYLFIIRMMNIRPNRHSWQHVHIALISVYRLQQELRI